MQNLLNEINYIFSDKCSVYDYNLFKNGQTSLIIAGLSGSGKSTIGNIISKKYNVSYVEEDSFPRVFDDEYKTNKIITFPQKEFLDLSLGNINSTIRIQSEMNKYNVGETYMIKSEENPSHRGITSIRLVITDIKKGVLKDWIKYSNENVIKNIINEYNVDTNEPSEFITFKAVSFKLSPTINNALNHNGYKRFIYEGVRLPVLYTKNPNDFKKIFNPSKYSILIVNTSFLISSWRALNRNKSFDFDIINRIKTNKSLLNIMNNFEKYINSLNKQKEKLNISQL